MDAINAIKQLFTQHVPGSILPHLKSQKPNHVRFPITIQSYIISQSQAQSIVDTRCHPERDQEVSNVQYTSC